MRLVTTTERKTSRTERAIASACASRHTVVTRATLFQRVCLNEHERCKPRRLLFCALRIATFSKMTIAARRLARCSASALMASAVPLLVSSASSPSELIATLLASTPAVLLNPSQQIK
jgi:hypothetical protein